MLLTEKGKKSLSILILLSVLGVLAIIGAVFTSIPHVAAPAVLPFFYYVYRKGRLHRRLEKTVLEHFGFKQVEIGKSLNDYAISKVTTTLNMAVVYEGHLENEPIRLYEFKTTVGRGKHKVTAAYMGLEFSTIKENHTVQICDSKHTFLNRFSGKASLESNEFNKTFKVFTKDARHAYYQLDPDTMHDLIEIKKALGSQINIETVGHKIFVYTQIHVYSNMFKDVLGFEDVLNDEISAEDLAHYHQVIPLFLKKFRQVFKLMDLQSQKIVS